jgi:hypothetical protein
MNKKILLVAIVILSFILATNIMAQTEKPTITPICKQCHQPEKNVLRGTLGNVSMKAETIQIQIGPAVWLVKFDDDTKVVGAEAINKIKKDHEISITYTEKDGKLYAIKVGVKPPAKIPEEKKMKTDELSKLVEIGPEKGNFVLIDSRPTPRYHEGHIPGAISIYDAEFDKHIDKLPKEKDKLIIFYCGGVT